MKIMKGCHICQIRLGEYSCKKCGKLVCNEHYDMKNGICTDCISDKIPILLK